MAELFLPFFLFFKSLRLWDRLSQKGWFTRKSNCWEGYTIYMKQLCGEKTCLSITINWSTLTVHTNSIYNNFFVLLWSRKRTPHPTRLTFHVRLHSRKTKRPQPLSGHENFSGFGLIVAKTPSISGISKLVLSNQYRQKFVNTFFFFDELQIKSEITLAHTFQEDFFRVYE
jgi:hypothetical protein